MPTDKIGDLTGLTAEQVATHLELIPLAAEGGRFRRIGAGDPDTTGRPAWSEILLLLDAGDYSALHRLALPETWHHQAGAVVDMLLLEPDGRIHDAHLGPDTTAGQRPSVTVPAGTWMGARVTDGGTWSLCTTTMQPGFVPADYEGAEPEHLAAHYPAAADRIRRLCRVGAATRMAGDGAHPIAIDDEEQTDA